MAGGLTFYVFSEWMEEQGVWSRLVCGSCLMACLFASSCASPYKPLKHHYGYSEQQVGSDEYQISFLGNGNTPYERVFDFALLRAAEIAFQRQAKSFAVSDAVNLSSVRRYQRPTQYYWTTSPYLSTGGRVVPSAPEFIGGTERAVLMEVPAEERVFYRPGVKLKIKLLPDTPGSFYPYDPAKVRERLRHKYRITG